MAVPEQKPIVIYSANGSTNRFPITFDLHDSRYLDVLKNKELVSSDLFDVENNKEVILKFTPKHGDEIIISRSTTLNRPTDFNTYDNSFRPDSLNFDLNKIWHTLQEQYLIDAQFLARLKGEIETRRTSDSLLQHQIDILNDVLVGVFDKASREYLNEKLNNLAHSLESQSKEMLKRLNDAIQSAAASGAGENGWIDLLVKTWSGRTQEDKNKDNISAQDFNAKGDNSTDDTQAFKNLEATYKNQYIDLKGKIYRVSSDFTGNYYYNGTFRTNVGTATNTPKGIVNRTASKYPEKVGNGQKIGEIVVPLYNDAAPTASTILQSAYYLPILNRIFTQRVVTIDGYEYGLIDCFDYDTIIQRGAVPLWTSELLPHVGHQSISVTRNIIANGYRAWTTVNKNIKVGENSRWISNFAINSSTGVVSDIRYFKVFGDDWLGTSVPVLSVSPCQTYIAITNTHPKKGRSIRVFKTSIFNEDGGDYSDKYIYEFGISFKNGAAPQSITLDGDYIYVLNMSGGNSYYNVDVYTIDGGFVSSDDSFSIGKAEVQSLPYTYYEPESMFIGDHGRLYAVIAGGKLVGANGRGPYTNLIMSVAFETTEMKRTDAGRPLYNFYANRVFAHANSKPITINSYDSTGGYIDYGEISQTRTRFSPPKGTYALQLYINDETQASVRVRNTLNDGQLQVSNSGFFGLFSLQSNKYLIALANGESEVTVQYPAKFLGSVSPTNNNAYSLGGSERVWQDVYLQNAPIVTSDERYKSDVRELSANEIECAKACAKLTRSYKLNDAIAEKGDVEARYHMGTIAQLIISVFIEYGLDWKKYGIITYEEWGDKYEPIIEIVSNEIEDENGNIVVEKLERDTGQMELVIAAGNKYYVRYEEFLCFISAGQNAYITQLEQRLKKIEQKLEAI